MSTRPLSTISRRTQDSFYVILVYGPLNPFKSTMWSLVTTIRLCLNQNQIQQSLTFLSRLGKSQTKEEVAPHQQNLEEIANHKTPASFLSINIKLFHLEQISEYILFERNNVNSLCTMFLHEIFSNKRCS